MCLVRHEIFNVRTRIFVVRYYGRQDDVRTIYLLYLGIRRHHVVPTAGTLLIIIIFFNSTVGIIQNCSRSSGSDWKLEFLLFFLSSGICGSLNRHV